MAWEKRNGNRYYYRKVWTGGTCQSEYLGWGFAALREDVALSDERKQREAERAERRTETELDRQVDTILAAIRTLRDAILHASGYHRHKGQWRKKRQS